MPPLLIVPLQFISYSYVVCYLFDISFTITGLKYSTFQLSIKILLQTRAISLRVFEPVFSSLFRQIVVAAKSHCPTRSVVSHRQRVPISSAPTHSFGGNKVPSSSCLISWLKAFMRNHGPMLGRRFQNISSESIRSHYMTSHKFCLIRRTDVGTPSCMLVQELELAVRTPACGARMSCAWVDCTQARASGVRSSCRVLW